MGENVINAEGYYLALYKMINFFKIDKTKVIITGLVWENNLVEDIHRKLAIDYGYKYFSFENFRNEPKNYSWGLFAQGAVAAHPSDIGMKTIAELLYNSTTEEN